MLLAVLEWEAAESNTNSKNSTSYFSQLSYSNKQNKYQQHEDLRRSLHYTSERNLGSEWLQATQA